MEQLLEDHENGPIHAILTTRKSKEDILADEYRRVQMEETFQPKINPVSKELAASRTSKEPIYEVLSKEGKKHRLNIVHLQRYHIFANDHLMNHFFSKISQNHHTIQQHHL